MTVDDNNDDNDDDNDDDSSVCRGDPRGSLRKTSGPPIRPSLAISAVESSR